MSSDRVTSPFDSNVVIPHPGTSYNPSKKDHKDLLDNVVKAEETIIRKEEHLNRVTTSMFDKMTAEQRDKARRKEMSAGIKELEEDDNDDEKGKFLIREDYFLRPSLEVLWL